MDIAGSISGGVDRVARVDTYSHSIVGGDARLGPWDGDVDNCN